MSAHNPKPEKEWAALPPAARRGVLADLFLAQKTAYRCGAQDFADAYALAIELLEDASPKAESVDCDKGEKA